MLGESTPVILLITALASGGIGGFFAWWYGQRLRRNLAAAPTLSAVDAPSSNANATREAASANQALHALRERFEQEHADLADTIDKLRRDLRGRQRTEQSLKENDEITLRIFENALDAVVVIDSNGNVTGWNSQAELTFGWSRSEIMGRRLSETIVPPELREAHDRGLKHFLLTGNGPVLNKRIEIAAIHRAGHEIPIELAISPMQVRGIWFFSAFVRDLTEQRRVQDALRQNAELLQSIVNNTTAIIYVKELDGRYFLVNKEYERIFQLNRAAIIGRTDHELFPKEHADVFRANDLEAIRVGSACISEESVALADGLHYYVSVKFPLYNAESDAYATCGISTDITERKQLEENLRHVQKLEAVGHLAGGVAHDFNNLLTVILGFADFLSRRMDTDHPWRASVLEIQKAAERAATLTQQLLAFSRKQMLVPVVLNLNEVVLGLRDMLARVMGADVELVTNLQEKLRPIRADAGQLEQVIVNLAMNARDAMPTGGRFTIATKNVTLHRREKRSQEEVPPGEYIHLSISDTGSGIDAKTLRHIFDPFFTTKEIGKGTGLGLATVYGIVRQSGGEIQVRSEVGAGATFTIFLPAVDAVTPVPAPSAPLVQLPSGTETILVIEDEEAIRHLSAEVLRQCGYRVYTACDAAEAFALFQEHCPNIQLVVADLVLPGMSGPSIVERLREMEPALRILYISGYDIANDRHALMQNLADRLLQKPFSTSHLAQAVREVLDGSPSSLTVSAIPIRPFAESE